MRDDLDSRLIHEMQERVAELGYELVDVRRRGTPRRVLLQVRVDRPDAVPGRGITIDECARISRALESWLDAEQILGTQYVLEVSSPGIERPVRWLEHWERYVGREVSVRLPERGRLRATILGVRRDPDAVVLRTGAGDAAEELTVSLRDARDATLAVDWEAVERLAKDAERAQRMVLPEGNG
jgi:ribosome maturation factor RimP